MVLYSPALLGNRMIEIQIFKIKNVSTRYAYDPHAIKKLAATVMRWNVVNDTDTGSYLETIVVNVIMSVETDFPIGLF